jgi:hypothetical protein
MLQVLPFLLTIYDRSHREIWYIFRFMERPEEAIKVPSVLIRGV